MAPNPTAVEDRISAFIDGWTAHAPSVTFSGMTCAQFAAKVKPSLEPRAKINDHEKQIVVARIDRNNADPVSIALMQKVAKSVAGDPNFGEDSPLYAAFGFVRKSDRASGLTRASKSGTKPASDKEKDKATAA